MGSLLHGMTTILRSWLFETEHESIGDLEGMPLPQVALGVVVSVVQFDQMYWVPISA